MPTKPGYHQRQPYVHPQEHEDEEDAGPDEAEGPQWKLGHLFTTASIALRKRTMYIGIIVKMPKAARYVNG